MQEEQLIQIFGLSLEETRILFSMEYLLVLKDIQETKQQEKRELKKQWLANWRLMVKKMISKDRKYALYTRFELEKAVRENTEKKEQNTWYKLILLDSVAHTALALEGKDN